MRIGIDIDGVLGDITTPLIEFHNDNYGTEIVFDDWTSYYIESVWECSRDEVERKIKIFFDSEYFEDIEVVGSAREAIERLSKEHELHVITARPKYIMEKTREWLDKNFPGCFEAIHHAEFGIYDTKSDFLKDLDIDILIDDHIDHILDCVKHNVKGLLMDYPWNQAEALPDNIVRVKDWEEIEGILSKPL